MNSKRKGNAGERELLHLLEGYGLDVHRNDQTFIGGVDNPDISFSAITGTSPALATRSPMQALSALVGLWPTSCRVEGIPVHVECKRTEKLSLYEAMEQAERDANGHALPVVMHRRNRKPWLVVIKLDDMMKLIRKE